MNLYKTAFVALACALAPLTACAAEPSTPEPSTDPAAGIASLMTPPTPAQAPVSRQCEGDLDFSCFDNWKLLEKNESLESNTFLDAVGATFLRSATNVSLSYLTDNGFVAGGILGDKQYCLMLVSGKSSEANDSYTATVMSRYYPETVAEFSDVTLETAKYLTEIVRQRCP